MTRRLGSALTRKLVRDLWHLRGQALTIALVVVAGVGTNIAMAGAYASLQRARDLYYARERFAEVFVHLERAPDAVAAELAQLPGVARVETRIVAPAMVPLPSVPEPIRALVVSLPAPELLGINRIEVVDGRWIDGQHPDEALLLKTFADANRIVVGDHLPAVLNGKKRQLRIVGVVRSPEYVFTIGAGELAPDPARFAVIYLAADALEATMRMEGAFNDASFLLQPGASVDAVIAGADRALERYGGLGAYARAKQASNYMLEGELDQLRGMSTVLPIIFLLVAVFLVNVVLSRLVHLQRPEIATLKALGYRAGEIGAHFLELVLSIVLVGAGAGAGIGVYLGGLMLEMYARYFRFPELPFTFPVASGSVAIGVCCLGAVVGGLGAVRAVMKLPPAEAMRPPAPARYRRSLIDRLRLGRLFGPAAQMVMRELERRPLRVLVSTAAIAASVGLTVIGGWYYEGVEQLMQTQFHVAMREDLSVMFTEPRPARAIRELAHLPGVLTAEGLRVVPVRFRVGHRSRDGTVVGYADGGEMRTLRDDVARPVPLPPDGVVLTDKLAELLGVGIGDSVDAELHEGQRGTRRLVVCGLVAEAFGLQGHMTLEAMQRWLGESDRRSLALLRIDPTRAEALHQRLKDLPYVMSVTRRQAILERFQSQSGGMILVISFIIALFAATITVGVVYNNARVSLSVRARDLASLRVLGFHRGEISAVLLGEMSVPVLLALLPGLALGRWFVSLLAATADPETYRMPIFLTSRSYAFAALVALVAAVLSALLVRRRLDRLDLIAVLKTRE